MNNEMENNTAPEEGQINTPAPQAAEPVISPGQVLSQRREELNLSVEQVAGQLNLAPRQVEAIEADNFAALPGMAIARGFVRSYAKLVKLDADPLLAAMAPAVAPMPEARPVNQAYISKPLAADRLNFGQRSMSSSKSMWVVVGVIAAGVAVAAALQFGVGTLWSGGERGDGAEPSVSTQQSPEQDGRAVEELPPPEVPVESEPVPAESATEPVSQSASPSAMLPTATPANADASPNAVAIDDTNALVLRMREESWIEIRRGDGAVIAARVFDAGSVESIPLKGELAIVVGNASGVDASLRGESLDLLARARGNVARVSVK